jgi:hypothetical protein
MGKQNKYAVTPENSTIDLIKKHKKKYVENRLPSLEEESIVDLEDGLKEKFSNLNLLNISEMRDGRYKVLEKMPITLIEKSGEERVVYQNRLSIMTQEECKKQFGDVTKIEKVGGKSNESQKVINR